MDLRQLINLVAIADHGSFSAAARSLYTVQSNVSMHIARLERELGVTLVDRQRGGLTDDGLQVVERARRVLFEVDDITADMASRGDEVRGETRFGVIGTTARWLLPQLLTQLGTQHPGVHVIVHEGNTSGLLPRLVAQQLDATIVQLPVDELDVTVEPLFAEDLVLLVHSRHHLIDRDFITLTELADEPLMLPPRGAALRRAIDRAAGAAGVELQAQVEKVYLDTFPNEKRVPNAKVQMEQHLKELRGGGKGGGVGFLSLLGSTASILKHTPGLELRSVRYKDGKLDIDMTVRDLQILDQLKQTLTQQAAVEVEIVSANARGDLVESRLQLRGHGS